MSFLNNIIIFSAALILFFCFQRHPKPDDSVVIVATNQDPVDESLIEPVDKSIFYKAAGQEVGNSVKKQDNVKTGSSPSLTS